MQRLRVCRSSRSMNVSCTVYYDRMLLLTGDDVVMLSDRNDGHHSVVNYANGGIQGGLLPK
jgi:hypothetical protein